MKIAQIIATLFVVFGCVLPSYARINETRQECIARYGQPVAADNETHLLVFMKGSFLIGINFFEDKADKILFRKVTQDILEKGEEISDDEIQILLKANGAGKEWRKIKTISIDRQWITNDGSIYAKYYTMSNNLILITTASSKREAEAEKSKDEKRLEGF